MRQLDNFMEDQEKINDLFLLSRIDFLIKHKDIPEENYNNTVGRIKQLIETRLKYNSKQRKIRNDNIEQARKNQLDYYYKNREKINARRNYLNKIKSAENRKYKKPSDNQIIKEYMQLHKEEIDALNIRRRIEEKLLYQTNYYFTKTKKKRQEAKLNGK